MVMGQSDREIMILAALASLLAAVAKACYWAISDTQGRKLGERKGLDTPVVLAVNDGY